MSAVHESAESSWAVSGTAMSQRWMLFRAALNNAEHCRKSEDCVFIGLTYHTVWTFLQNRAVVQSKYKSRRDSHCKHHFTFLSRAANLSFADRDNCTSLAEYIKNYLWKLMHCFNWKEKNDNEQENHAHFFILISLFL